MPLAPLHYSNCHLASWHSERYNSRPVFGSIYSRASEADGSRIWYILFSPGDAEEVHMIPSKRTSSYRSPGIKDSLVFSLTAHERQRMNTGCSSKYDRSIWTSTDKLSNSALIILTWALLGFYSALICCTITFLQRPRMDKPLKLVDYNNKRGNRSECVQIWASDWDRQHESKWIKPFFFF